MGLGLQLLNSSTRRGGTKLANASSFRIRRLHILLILQSPKTMDFYRWKPHKQRIFIYQTTREHCQTLALRADYEFQMQDFTAQDTWHWVALKVCQTMNVWGGRNEMIIATSSQSQPLRFQPPIFLGKKIEVWFVESDTFKRPLSTN